MKLQEIVASHRLLVEKKSGVFVYDIQLEKHVVSGLYRMGRRWGYQPDIDKYPIKWTDWNTKYLDQFQRKVYQKLAMMGYWLDEKTVQIELDSKSQ